MADRIAHRAIPVIVAASFKENDNAFGLGDIGGTAADCCDFFDFDFASMTHS
jgi:hypothetical protein